MEEEEKKPSSRKKKTPKGKKSRPVVLKPSKNRNFASPSDKYNIDRGEGISKLFKKLGVNDKEEEGIMFVHYTYEWWESELLG